MASRFRKQEALHQKEPAKTGGIHTNINLVKVEQTHFHNVTCDVYTNQHGKFFMTREQIGQALEYTACADAIRKIHERDKDRLDRFSVTDKLSGTDGKKYDTYLYNARGVYEICRHSHQPKADEFYDHVYDLLEGMRLGYIKIEAERQSPQWQTARMEGKKTRRSETDAIKAFVEYARAHGSKSADKYYIHFTKLANEAAGVIDRDAASTAKLLDLRVAEQMIDNAILAELDAGTEYHEAFRHVKDRVKQIAVIVFAPRILKTAATKAS